MGPLAPLGDYHMITTTITEYSFRDAFHAYGRGDNFKYESLTALFEYLEQLSEDIDQPIELDVIGLCCEFSEIYLQDTFALYDCGDNLTNDEALEWLQERTTVIEVDLDEGLVIIQDF